MGNGSHLKGILDTVLYCSAFLSAFVGTQINTSAASFVLVLVAVAVAVAVCCVCNLDQELFLDPEQFWCDPSLVTQGSLHKYNMVVANCAKITFRWPPLCTKLQASVVLISENTQVLFWYLVPHKK